jgi:hypothetical protein
MTSDLKLAENIIKERWKRELPVAVFLRAHEKSKNTRVEGEKNVKTSLTPPRERVQAQLLPIVNSMGKRSKNIRAMAKTFDRTLEHFLRSQITR